MKNTIKKGLLFLGMIVTGGITYSQIKISGEIRPRMEYRRGYKTLAASDSMNNALFVDQRTRLNFDYKKERIEFKVVLQDVRIWGSQKQLVTNEDFGMSVHEAYGKVYLNDSWALKFGRQELVYDDHRIFGSVNWVQQARSHDALLFQYKKSKLKFDIGAAYNQDSQQLKTTDYTVGGSYKTMQYLWANYKVSDAFNFSVLALSVGQQVNFTNKYGNVDFQDNYTLTAGSRLVYKKDKLGIASNLYYQMGSTNTWPALNVSAYDISLDISYQVMKSVKLTLGLEMLSGNSQTDTSASYLETQRAFNPYFGTNHKFNGYMDYFYVGNHIGNVGLNDASLRVDYKNDKFSLGITGHIFMSNADVRDWNDLTKISAMDPYMGTEIDFFGAFNLAPGAKVKFGYSNVFASSTMVAIKGGDSGTISNWGYVMIIMKPTLFEQKEKKKEN